MTTKERNTIQNFINRITELEKVKKIVLLIFKSLLGIWGWFPLVFTGSKLPVCA